MDVPARELRNRLGKYLRRVRSERLTLAQRLARMADAGDLTLPSGRPVARFRPVPVHGKPVSATLLEDRE